MSILNYKSVVDDACRAYVDDCKEACEILNDESLLRPLCSSLVKHGPVSLLSRACMTIKTHKPEGSVKPRMIHNASTHPFSSGMKFVVMQVKDKLRALEHVVINTDHFLRDLKNIAIPEDSVFLQV